MLSAHFECPHCGWHLRDGDKTRMDKLGEWRPTCKAAPGYMGWHLPSLYASSPDTSCGRLAVKFLQAKGSLQGLQGFINGDLAEPFESQETRSQRVEIVVQGDAPKIEGAIKLLTADYQLTTPHFWYVVREWRKDSRLVEQGWLDNWEELRQKQLAHAISDHHVCVDSGYAAEEVYNACLAHGHAVGRPHALPLWVGWLPAKGFTRRGQWTHPKTGIRRPYTLGRAALATQRIQLCLLEFSDDHLKDMLARLRRQKTRYRWEVPVGTDETYWRHLDGEYKREFHSPRTGRSTWEWVRRSKRWPNHLLDCEVMQLGMALLHRLLPWESDGTDDPQVTGGHDRVDHDEGADTAASAIVSESSSASSRG
jgi:hypothetical protein